MSTELPRENPLEVQEFLPRHWLLRRVTCPNPFYLLSAACVIHATAVPLGTSGRGLEPESLLGIVIGYAIVLALITIVIVRRWKVWDDARSNFFILLLLFLELALSADGILQASPERGARLLMIGLAAAIGVSELVLRALRLKLPAVYRVPYYAQLALMFLSPLWLLPTLQANDGTATTWRIFAFPFLAGATILSLLPAVRRGPRAIEQNGSPWNWAWYPWTVFGALGGCLALRSYTLCLSFDAVRALRADAAYRLENIFGPYFLAPMLLAAALLVLEASVHSGKPILRRIALLLPILVVAISFPGAGRNAAASEFISRLLDTIGSPVWWVIVASSVYYGVAAVRGIAGARTLMVASLVALAFIDRSHTISLQTLAPMSVWPMIAATVLSGVGSLTSRRSIDWCQTAILAALTVARLDFIVSLTVPPVILAGHLAALIALATGIAFNDRLAHHLRHFGAATLLLVSLATCVWLEGRSDPAWFTPAYFALVTLLILLTAWLRPSRTMRMAAAANLAVAYAGLIAHGYHYAQRAIRWQGLPTLLIGFLLLHLGLFMSAWKAGAIQQAVRGLLRVDSADRTAGDG
jgi:hypothetical protein